MAILADRRKGFKSDLKNKNKKKKNKRVQDASNLIRNSWMRKIAPRRSYEFKGDYFKIDNTYATIVSVFNQDGADDALAPMWGISLIPYSLSQMKGVSTHLLTNIERAEQKWVEEAQSKADDASGGDAEEAASSGKRSEKTLSSKRHENLDEIARDLMSDGYLHVSFRLLIKATSLSLLDDALLKLTRYYDGQFDKVYVEPYHAQQFDEYQNLYRKSRDQLGRNYGFTSSELAGEYNLVTHGLDDDDGKYVGMLQGDVNSSAMMWNIDKYDHHIVFASSSDAETIGSKYKNVRASTLWGIKLAEEALLNNHRVVHFVMNDATLDLVDKGFADLSDITTTISLSNGDINPFEIFGEVDGQLGAFSMFTEKMRLIVQQLNPDVDSLALELLSAQLQKFFINEGMWLRNAQDNQEKLRVIGLPHRQYPMLSKFTTYLKIASNSAKMNSNDSKEIAEYRLLYGIFQRMMNENGDLFNRITTDTIDNTLDSQMVVYDLSELLSRGKGIAMAQFVNVLGYATQGLSEGDVVIFHGMDMIDINISDYVKTVLETLSHSRIRYAFFYDNLEKMLAPNSYANLPRADWLLLGSLTNPDVLELQNILKETIPSNLVSNIVKADAKTYYLKRNFDNIVFNADFVV